MASPPPPPSYREALTRPPPAEPILDHPHIDQDQAAANSDHLHINLRHQSSINSANPNFFNPNSQNMQRIARNFLHKSISFSLRSRTSISPSLLEPLINPNFSSNNLQGVSSRNFCTTASRGDDQSDKIAERIGLLISCTASCESSLKRQLESAASYLRGYSKHNDLLREEAEECRRCFDDILESIEELREKVSAEDKMVLQKWLRCLEVRVLPMEDRIKKFEHEVRTHQISDIVLGFVLRIHKHQSMVKKGTAWSADLVDPLDAAAEMDRVAGSAVEG